MPPRYGKPWCNDLDRSPVTDPTDPDRVTNYALVPVTIARLTPVNADGTEYEVSGPTLDEYALIDTGATSSAVHPSLADALDLEMAGSEGDIGSPERTSVTRVRITIAVIGAYWELFVIERPYDLPQPSEVQSQDTDEPAQLARVLIGTDILKDCALTYNGPDRGRFCLVYLGQVNVRVGT